MAIILRAQETDSDKPGTATPPRSSEELAMRATVEAWGRARWPGCRVMHELDVGNCRIDLAFVSPHHLVGVEIKSSRDTLDRLPRQIKNFVQHLPEVWVAAAPKWREELDRSSHAEGGLPWNVGRIFVMDGQIDEITNLKHGWKRPARPDEMLITPMLHLLLKDEAGTLAYWHGIRARRRDTKDDILRAVARGLTGDQIVHGVCRLLRCRSTGWEADPPISPWNDDQTLS